MRALWGRLRLTWRVLFHGLPPTGHAFEDEVRRLVGSHSWRAALYAVEKIKAQPRLRVAGHDTQKAEAVEWGHTFGREVLGTKLDNWTLRFLIEVVIGMEKGRLPKL